jgi:cellulose synthase/poly-beta-1,6-N-acetylglucosamine synthase-like glycosyltransferase
MILHHCFYIRDLTPMVAIQVAFLVSSLLLTFMFFLYGFNHYYLLSMIHRYRPPRLNDIYSNLRPFVSVQLPIYNERYVVRQLVAACVHMVERYGKDRAEIMILDDSTDDTAEIVDAIIEEFTPQGVNIKVQRRENRRGYKAGALQTDLENTQAEFLAIFDADYTPPDDFLVRTSPICCRMNSLPSCRPAGHT